MRVVIEVQNGVQAGHKFLLREHDLVVIGRSEWADHVFKHDASMANKHFSIHAHDGQVQLRDLGTATGTLVNQQPVEIAQLYNGDMIRAGSTQFTAWIDNSPDRPGAAGTAPATISVAKRRRDSVSLCVPWSGPIPFRSQTCDSGLLRLRGGPFGAAQQPPTASALARVLATLCPATFILDPQQMEPAHVAGLRDAARLFEWLPVDPERPGSPIVLPAGSDAQPHELIDAMWDKNALAIFYSPAPPEQLTHHLQSATQFQVAGAMDDEPLEHVRPTAPGPEATGRATQAVLGYCWPTVLCPLLCYSPPAFVERLLEGIHCVLLEAPGRRRCWQLWCRAEFLPELEQVGLTETPSARDAD